MSHDELFLEWPANVPLPQPGETIDPRIFGTCIVDETIHQSHHRSGRPDKKLVRVSFYLPTE